MFLVYLLMVLLMLLSISFFTIMERKLLGSFHIHLGPNKMGMMGAFQPFYDALKLFSKKMFYISKINLMYWNMSPVIIFILFLFIMNFNLIKCMNNYNMKNMIIIIFLISLSIFPMFYSSYFSFSKYSIISAKRIVVQMISYEMGIMLILLLMMPVFIQLDIEMLMWMLKKKSIMMLLIIFLFLYLMVLGETGRTPFDFIEGESELISGFNIEFSSSYFSLFFIYEYGMMLFFSLLFSLMFISFYFFFLIMFLFIWCRASLPRFRYDNMMEFFWKICYPFLITFLIMFK